MIADLTFKEKVRGKSGKITAEKVEGVRSQDGNKNNSLEWALGRPKRLV